MNAETERFVARLKALADPVRLRVVALCGRGECSVSELTGVLALSQPRVSQHLKQLCAAGLLERFRDGHYVYYRAAGGGADAASRRRLLALMPADDPAFARDFDKLRHLRGPRPESLARSGEGDRALHRALVGLTVATPLGDLVDIGCGQGRILKLLASRARRAVGVDIDSDARRFARAELLLAGLPNCSLRQGDMYDLPFPDDAFDTAILDDVLGAADRPTDAIEEAVRILRPGGRLLLLASVAGRPAADVKSLLGGWCAQTGLRLAPPRAVPSGQPAWLLAVATRDGAATAAA